jgi:hypothetical protein
MTRFLPRMIQMTRFLPMMIQITRFLQRMVQMTRFLPRMIQMTMELPSMAMTRMREKRRVQMIWSVCHSSSSTSSLHQSKQINMVREQGLKGMCLEINTLLEGLTDTQCSSCLVEEKTKIKILLASMKLIYYIIIKIVPKVVSEFLVRAFFSVIGRFFPVSTPDRMQENFRQESRFRKISRITGGFRNTCKSHTCSTR